MSNDPIALAEVVSAMDSRADPGSSLSALADGRETLVIDCVDAQRLPVALLAAARDGAKPIDLINLTRPAQAAIAALGVSHLALSLGPADPPAHPDTLAYLITGDALGVVTITARPGAGQHQQIVAPTGLDWLRGLDCRRVVVDLGSLEHINSILVAWLLRITQLTSPAPIDLRNVRPTVAAQLRQLRLNHLMNIP